MGYHPETLAFSFPPYPRGGMSLSRHPKPWSLGRWFYSLGPWIGFDVWHIDPESRRKGQRTDDSCGWFDRTPGPYQAAVDEFLKDTASLHDVGLTLARRKHMPMPFYEGLSEPRTETDRAVGYPRLSQADTLALALMIATQLERTRWWRKRYPAAWWRRPFIRERDVMPLAVSLALNPTDNLSSTEEPEAMVRLIAGALHREIRPWWKHPRWHVCHWKINVNLFHNLRRMFQRCPGCGKRLGFGYCPTNYGSLGDFHGDCSPAGQHVP